MRRTVTPPESRRDARPAALRAILNPAAGGGRAWRRRAAIGRALRASVGQPVPLDVTPAPGGAEGLARHAAQAGASTVVAVGGDGTVHEVVNGLVRRGRAYATLGVVDGGTGSGLAQSLGLPASLEAQVVLVTEGATRRVDLGRLRHRTATGETATRRFVSECQLGVGAVVSARLGRLGRRLGGRLGFGTTALWTGLRQRAVDMHLVIDGDRMLGGPLLGVAVANGSRCAGGMRLAPEARLDDGLLDVVLIHDVPVRKRPGLLAALYAGRHVDGPYCTVLTARHVALWSEHDVPVAADGEVLGRAPCVIQVEPGVLPVRCPERSR